MPIGRDKHIVNGRDLSGALRLSAGGHISSFPAVLLLRVPGIAGFIIIFVDVFAVFHFIGHGDHARHAVMQSPDVHGGPDRVRAGGGADPDIDSAFCIGSEHFPDILRDLRAAGPFVLHLSDGGINILR